MRTEAINRLIHNWERLVEDGSIDAETMIKSLKDQANGYRDMSLEDLESDYELARIMGYGIEGMTDAQMAEWQGVVNEAAQKYLLKRLRKEVTK